MMSLPTLNVRVQIMASSLDTKIQALRDGQFSGSWWTLPELARIIHVPESETALLDTKAHGKAWWRERFCHFARYRSPAQKLDVRCVMPMSREHDNGNEPRFTVDVMFVSGSTLHEVAIKRPKLPRAVKPKAKPVVPAAAERGPSVTPQKEGGKRGAKSSPGKKGDDAHAGKRQGVDAAELDDAAMLAEAGRAERAREKFVRGRSNLRLLSHSHPPP